MNAQMEDRPCYCCGESACVKQACVDDLAADALFQRRLTDGEIDAQGNELGEFCIYCRDWFPYAREGVNAIYCGLVCEFRAQRD